MKTWNIHVYDIYVVLFNYFISLKTCISYNDNILFSRLTNNICVEAIARRNLVMKFYLVIIKYWL